MISVLTLDRRRPLKDGRYPLKIKVGFGTGVLIGTGVSCLDSEWSERAQVYSGPNATMVNRVLSSRLSEVISRAMELEESGRLQGASPGEIRRLLEPGPAADPRRMDFSSIAEECIGMKRRSASTVTSMRQTVRQVEGFAGGSVYLEDIDPRWLSGLELHIGGKPNAIAVHMRNIRTIFNYAIDEGYTTAYPFRKYKIRTEATPDRSLSAEELRRIFSYPCAPWQQEYVDIFKLIFLLCGINMKDLAELRETTSGRIEYNRAKTGVHCSLMVQPEAERLLNLYRGKNRLISILDRYASHADYLHHFNAGLQALGTSWTNGSRRTGSPLYPGISSYWARYSWASIAAEIDIPIDTIGAALGHSRGKTITAIYVRTDMRRKVDDANRKVIDYVLYGKDWRDGK